MIASFPVCTSYKVIINEGVKSTTSRYTKKRSNSRAITAALSHVIICMGNLHNIFPILCFLNYDMLWHIQYKLTSNPGIGKAIAFIFKRLYKHIQHLAYLTCSKQLLFGQRYRLLCFIPYSAKQCDILKSCLLLKLVAKCAFYHDLFNMLLRELDTFFNKSMSLLHMKGFIDFP